MTTLQDWRIQNGYSLNTIAESVGSSVQTVANWQNGKAISAFKRQRFIEVFDVDPVEDFGLNLDLRIIGGNQPTKDKYEGFK